MDEFIRSHVKSLQSTSARPPKPISCLRVERTAPRSVAGHAGIAAGDLLVSLDGGPASKADPKLYKHRATKRLYTFFSHARAEQVELACTGIEIGVELAYTSEAIKVRYKPARVRSHRTRRALEGPLPSVVTGAVVRHAGAPRHAGDSCVALRGRGTLGSRTARRGHGADPGLPTPPRSLVDDELRGDRDALPGIGAPAPRPARRRPWSACERRSRTVPSSARQMRSSA